MTDRQNGKPRKIALNVLESKAWKRSKKEDRVASLIVVRLGNAHVGRGDGMSSSSSLHAWWKLFRAIRPILVACCNESNTREKDKQLTNVVHRCYIVNIQNLRKGCSPTPSVGMLCNLPNPMNSTNVQNENHVNVLLPTKWLKREQCRKFFTLTLHLLAMRPR